MGKKPAKWAPPEDAVMTVESTDASWTPPSDAIPVELKKKGNATVEAGSKDTTGEVGFGGFSEPSAAESKPSGEATEGDKISLPEPSITTPPYEQPTMGLRALSNIFEGAFALGKKAISTVKDEMVGSYYTEKAIEKKTDLIDELIRTQPEKYRVTNEYASDETRRKYAEKQALKEFGADLPTKIKEYATTSLKEKQADLAEAERQKQEGAKFTEGIPRTWGEAVKAGKISSYIGAAMGNGLAHIPLSIASLGTSSYFMEKAGAYDEALGAIAKESGLTPEEVVAQGKDQPAKDIAHIVGLVNGAIDLGSSIYTVGKGIGSGIKQIVKKKATEEILKKIPEGLLGKGANLVKAPLVEYGTEFLQGTNSQIGAILATGKKIEDIDFNKEIDWSRSHEEGLQGLFGSIGVGGAAHILSPSQVVSEQHVQVKNSGDLGKAAEVATKIQEAVNNASDEKITPEVKTGNDTGIAATQDGDSQVAKDSGITSIEDNEVQRQFRPIADKMTDLEREFDNAGLDIDTHYDGETLVTDNKTGEIVEPEDLSEHLKEKAGQYEQAAAKLTELDEQNFIKVRQQSRKEFQGQEVKFEEVKNQPTEGEQNDSQNQQRLPGDQREGQAPVKEEPVEGTGGEKIGAGRVLQKQGEEEVTNGQESLPEGVDVHKNKKKVFVYGTLKNPATRFKVLGEHVETTEHTLPGMSKQNGEFSTLKNGGETKGQMMEVTPEQLEKLDKYEENYDRKEVSPGVFAYVRKPDVTAKGTKRVDKKDNFSRAVRKFHNIDSGTPRISILKFFATGGKMNLKEAMERTGLKAKDLFGWTSTNGVSWERLTERVKEDSNQEEADEADIRDQIDYTITRSKKDVFDELRKHLSDPVQEEEDVAEVATELDEDNQEAVVNLTDEFIDDELTDDERDKVNAILQHFSVNGQIQWEEVLGAINGFDPMILELTNNAYEKLEERANEGGKRSPVTADRPPAAKAKAPSKVAAAKQQLQDRLAKAKAAHQKLQVLGAVFDPEQRAKDLLAYHTELVGLAKDAIKLGLATIEEFAELVGQKIDEAITKAWEGARNEILKTPIPKELRTNPVKIKTIDIDGGVSFVEMEAGPAQLTMKKQYQALKKLLDCI